MKTQPVLKQGPPMKKLTIFTLLSLFSILSYETKPNGTFQIFHSQDEENFKNFCNNQFSDYKTSDLDQDLLGGWTVDKLLQRLPKRTKYHTYIIAYMYNDICIGFVCLKVHFKQEHNQDLEHLYYVNNPDTHDYDYVLIETTFVRPEFRNQGIGTQLISKALKVCEDLQVKRVLRIGKSYNVPINNIYKKLEFTQLNPEEMMLYTPYKAIQEKIKNMDIIMLTKQIS